VQIERAMNPKTKRPAVVPTIPELEAIADKLGSDTKFALVLAVQRRDAARQGVNLPTITRRAC
jgi:hypothetical protein